MKNNKKNKVAIAMSGGVDSSMAAKILQKKGYECLGIFMRLGVARTCCDETAARRVCQKLGIKFYPLDFRRQFKQDVKKYFLEACAAGLTPNPCVKCNQLIKFGALLKRAGELGCRYLATGHYLKLKKIKSRKKDIYKIFRAKDLSKDQTYFLYNLKQKDLARLIFPLGDSLKEKIRLEARAKKIPFLKNESQDACFLSGGYADYLKNNLKLKPGEIKTLRGEIIGQHQGLPLYTIGQRKGVEIGGSGPYYAAKRDFKANTLYVAADTSDPALLSRTLKVEKINWISGFEPKFPFKCAAAIRYNQKEEACLVKKISKEKYEVEFLKPQRAVTPGQSAVFYKNNELLGGGIICE